MNKKVVALINEDYDVIIDQINMMNMFFGVNNWHVVRIKNKYWGSKYFAAMHKFLKEESTDVVFLSNAPLLLAEMAYSAGINHASEDCNEPRIWILHCNKKIPVSGNGFSYYVKSKDDWHLLPIN